MYLLPYTEVLAVLWLNNELRQGMCQGKLIMKIKYSVHIGKSNDKIRGWFMKGCWDLARHIDQRRDYCSTFNYALPLQLVLFDFYLRHQWLNASIELLVVICECFLFLPIMLLNYKPFQSCCQEYVVLLYNSNR